MYKFVYTIMITGICLTGTQAQELSTESLLGHWLNCSAQKTYKVNDTLSFIKTDDTELSYQQGNCKGETSGISVWQFGDDKQLHIASQFTKNGALDREEEAVYTPWKVIAKKKIIKINTPGYKREYRVLSFDGSKMVIMRTE